MQLSLTPLSSPSNKRSHSRNALVPPPAVPFGSEGATSPGGMGNRPTRPAATAPAHAEEPPTNDEPSVRSVSQRSVSQRSNTSYYGLLKNSYQALVNAIIRPPRLKYNVSQLGPASFRFAERKFVRTDLTLTNSRGLKFVCSWWEPAAEDRPADELPCVIYMHGNSSARVESISTLSSVLSLGATVFALDFCGSGQSDGEYVSLGAFEKDDLQAVIEHLRTSGKVSTIALWGRSMGAATALLHGERDPSIAGMVLDSAFADLVMLAEEMVEKGRQQGLFAPNLLVRLAIKFVRSSVQKSAGFDIKALSPIEHADKCFIPALFVAAEGDSFVAPSHSHKIYERYGGDKNLVLVEGDHNSARPGYLFDSIAIFLQSALQIPYERLLHAGQGYTRRPPWTYHQSMLRDDMTADEMLMLSLMGDEDQVPDGYDAEAEMRQDLEDTLYALLSGGASADTGDAAAAARRALMVEEDPRHGGEGDPEFSSMTLPGDGDGEGADDGDESPAAKMPLLLNARRAQQNRPWPCEHCTCLNVPECTICQACDMPR